MADIGHILAATQYEYDGSTDNPEAAMEVALDSYLSTLEDYE